jgi:hypothetical protein
MGRDGTIAVGVLALCAILWRQLGAVPANPLVPIGPTFYPKILLGVTAFLGLALLVADLTSGRRPDVAGRRRGWTAYRPAVVAFGVSILYAWLLPGIGYLAATSVFVAGLAWGLGSPTLRRVPGNLLLGLLTAAGTYLLFERYLQVFLPTAGWLR